MRPVNRVIEGFEDLVVALGLGIATTATCIDVIARYLFGASISGGGELTNICIIWAAMIGAAVAARTGVHIGVDVVVKRMPARVAKITVLTSLVISALFTAWVTYLGIELVLFSYETQQVTMELLVPRWPLFLSVPIGMALMTYHLIVEVIHRWRVPAEEFLVTEESELGLEAAQDISAAHPGA